MLPSRPVAGAALRGAGSDFALRSEHLPAGRAEEKNADTRGACPAASARLLGSQDVAAVAVGPPRGASRPPLLAGRAEGKGDRGGPGAAARHAAAVGVPWGKEAHPRGPEPPPWSALLSRSPLALRWVCHEMRGEKLGF